MISGHESEITLSDLAFLVGPPCKADPQRCASPARQRPLVTTTLALFLEIIFNLAR